MVAIKHIVCQKCGSAYQVSMGEMTQQDFDDYLADADRLTSPYFIQTCDYCKIKTLNKEIAWELIEPEPEE